MGSRNRIGVWFVWRRKGREVAESGHVGHSGSMFCPVLNVPGHAHCLHLTFSIHWIPSPRRVAGNRLSSCPSALLPFNILFLASPLHLCVASLHFFYSVTSLLIILYYNCLGHASVKFHTRPGMGGGCIVGGLELGVGAEVLGEKGLLCGNSCHGHCHVDI